MTYLLDSSVPIDALNNRNGRPELLSQLSQQNILLACCAVNVTELHMGIRHGKSANLPAIYSANSERQGKTLGIADVSIAAVEMTHNLVLVTDNSKHFPMPDLKLLQFPAMPESNS